MCSRAVNRLGWGTRGTYNSLDDNFFAYDAVGGVSIGAADTDLTLDTEVTKGSPYTHIAGSAEITIDKTGWYNIDANAGFSLNEDDIIEIRIQRDTGGGYVDLPGAAASCGA